MAQNLAEQDFFDAAVSRYSSAISAIFDYPLFQEQKERACMSMNQERFRVLLAGKRVCIVGPSQSFLTLDCGAFIDSFDIVVRLNFQWPLSSALQQKLGSRMDVLYHCCNGDYPIADLYSIPAFSSTKFVCFEVGIAAFELLKHCEKAMMPTLPTSEGLDEMRAALGTFPNTGAFAIRHILQHPVKELYLAGLTFYCENYYSDYRGDGAKDPRWLSQSALSHIWKHDFGRQLEWFKSVYRDDPRVHVDHASAEVMGLAAQPRLAGGKASQPIT